MGSRQHKKITKKRLERVEIIASVECVNYNYMITAFVEQTQTVNLNKKIEGYSRMKTIRVSATSIIQQYDPRD